MSTRMELTVITFSERPELWDDTAQLSAEVWPEYNLHGDVLGRYWDRLFTEFPEFQFALYDVEREEVVAEGHTVPCAWDGTPEGLGGGIDEMAAAAFAAREQGRAPTALCALAAEIHPRAQGRGLADRVLGAMSGLAERHGLAHLIAPVRPSLKDHYPLTPIEEYAAWTREDGQPFDPWIRVHVRRGGVLVKPVARSMRIRATVGQWERWTGMRFPADGEYEFPAGLAPLQVDVGRDTASYWEPNVWIVHRVGRRS